MLWLYSALEEAHVNNIFLLFLEVMISCGTILFKISFCLYSCWYNPKEYYTISIFWFRQTFIDDSLRYLIRVSVSLTKDSFCQSFTNFTFNSWFTGCNTLYHERFFMRCMSSKADIKEVSTIHRRCWTRVHRVSTNVLISSLRLRGG